MLYFEANIICQACFFCFCFFLYFFNLRAVGFVRKLVNTTLCQTQDITISGYLQYSKLHTQKAYGFSVPESTPADTFRLGPSDGATTVSCFDLWHTGDAMFVKAINEIHVGAELNNKSQISR